MGEIQPEKCEGRELTKINWQIGVYGYYLANASENTISGGFISGGPNNMTVIRSVGKSSRNHKRIVQFPSLVRCRCLAPQIACSTISSP